MLASNFQKEWSPRYIAVAFEEEGEQLPFGFSNPKRGWFIKDEPQRAGAVSWIASARCPALNPLNH